MAFDNLIEYGPICKSQVTNVNMIIRYKIEDIE